MTTATEPSVSLEDLYLQSLRGINEGEIVKGQIIAISPKDVLIDIGYKSEGSIGLYEFGDPKALKVGDEVDVLVESIEDEHGTVVLSKHKADRQNPNSYRL